MEQMRAISSLIEMLDAWEKSSDTDEVMICQPIRLAHPSEPDVLLGYLVDEVGGMWAFRPAVHQ